MGIQRKRRKTTAEFKAEIFKLQPNIEILNEYTGCKTENRIQCKCKICEFEWDTAPASLRNGSGCPNCANERRRHARRKTHQQFVHELSLVQPNIEVLSKYDGAHRLVHCKCRIHDFEWDTYPANLLNNTSHCPECTREKMREQLIANHDNFINELQRVRSDVIVIGKYNGYHNKILCRCFKHNVEFNTSPRCLFARYTVCPECKLEDENSSHGERRVAKYLRRNNLKYHFDYTLDECVYILPLILDFYLPDYNIGIEYDGQQHFYPVSFDGKSDAQAQYEHENCKIRDEIKNQYCKDHGIDLLRIPYWEFDNIDSILDDYLDPQRLSDHLQ